MTATAPIQYAFELGQEVMWLTRPDAYSDDGYLHGTVSKLGACKVKIVVMSKFGQPVEKWTLPDSLRAVGGPV